MVEPITNSAPQDSLSPFMAQRQWALMAAPEWSALQGLDFLRERFDAFFGALNDEEKLEYVRLQGAWIDAQKSLEGAIERLTDAFKLTALEPLRAGLKTLAGRDIDPTVACIHTRYLHAAQSELKVSDRPRRAADGGPEGTIKVASLTLWDAACLNYDGLTGWSFPGHTGLADASYLDEGINITARQFIALVRKLDIGGQLKTQLVEALRADGPLGSGIAGLAKAEFEFALIEALKNTNDSRIDRDNYQQVRRALDGEVSWGQVEEMLLFIPHGVDTISWIPQRVGYTGQFVAPPRGESLSIPHIVFAVDGCPGAFSFFPNRPGGSLRHHDNHREACEEFYVAFDAFYSRGKVDWLYQAMLWRDSARLIKLVKATPPPDLEGFALLLYRLAQSIPVVSAVKEIGYSRRVVQKAPVASLTDFYVKRGRANLQEQANETPGFMPTMLELFQTLISEILNVLLIPVPGALKGLGRVRAFAMFVAMKQALVEGGHQALQGEPGELLQGLADLADLLISGRLHTRLAKSVQHRHQRLYRQLSEPRSTTSEVQSLSNPALLERMLASQDTAVRDREVVLDVSGTPRQVLNQVWEGAPPSASLVEAVHRFKIDRLIDWVIAGANPSRPAPLDAVHVMAPLLTQMDAWPVGTALSIQNAQGLEVRRYSKSSTRPATQVVTVTELENYQFAYAMPRRLAAHLPQAIVGLLPAVFSAGEQQIRQQLTTLAKAFKIDLFDALTQFPEASRTLVSDASASVRKFLPDSVGREQPVPAVIAQLHALHPRLSQARLLEVLRAHPLSEHQQAQLLLSKLQPEALYEALRTASQVSRRETIVDGLFYPRRFDQQTQGWAAEFAASVLRDCTGQALVVSPAAQAVPYVSQGARDRTMVIIDEGRGRYAPYNHHQSRKGAVVTGADSFYKVIVSQFSEVELSRLGWSAQQAITQFRHQVAHVMLSNRAPLDGSFYPAQREIAQYVHVPDSSRIAVEPDGLGLYPLGDERYLFLEGEYFKVSQAAPSQPWRIEHPSLHDAYAPALIHNGTGAWRHEWETPLTWHGHKPFYRLGPVVRALSPDAIEQIQQISGVTPGILRRVHARNERLPVMLVEAIERFSIRQRVKAGVAVGQDFYDELLGEVGPEHADTLVGQAGGTREEQIRLLESKVKLDKPRMERLFYRALCHKSEQSSDPLAQVLQRHFPSLTAAVAEGLVHQASADEMSSLEAGRVPLTFTPYVRWWLRYLRKARALEGLYLPAAANADSTKLILHTLPDIDRWPSQVRVEVWERDRLIDSIGPADSSLKRVMVPLADGYQAYILQPDGERQPIGSPGAFLPVLLSALPPLERQAFGYTHVSAIEELTQELGHRLATQQGLTDTLLGTAQPAWYNPPRRMADGRIGYPLSGGDVLGPTDREQVARMRELFPAKTDQEVFEILENLSDSVRERGEAIDTLFKEREALDSTLERWSAQAGEAGQQTARSEAAARIRRCWRKEESTRGVTFELNLDDLGLDDLPPISAHFGHVMLLSVRNNQLQALPKNFLRRFPGLRRLFLDGNRLEHVPQGLSAFQHLKLLSLSNNRIQPNLSDVMRLEGLVRLTHLNLSHNPLGRGRRLRLYGLNALQVLTFRSTQIDLLPQGAVTLRALRVFDLRDNHFKVLTDADLYLNENVHRAMNLHGNTLTQGTLQLLNHYRARPGYQTIDFGLWHNGTFPLPSVERWLVTVPLNDMPRWRAEWALLAREQMADRFFNLLWNLSSYPPLIALEHQALRQNISQRVWQLIESANHNSRLKRILFQAPLQYMSGGIDGWVLCLNDIELSMLPVQMLVGNVDAAGPDFLNYYRALRRLKSIDFHLSRQFPQHTARGLCVHVLAYRIALAPSLDLPLAPPGRFDAAIAVPHAGSVDELRQRILREEVHITWPQRLENEGHWVEFLERKYPQDFEASLRQYHQALQLATDKVGNGDMTEGAYKIQIEALAEPMLSAKANLVGRLTLQEWNDFAHP